MAGFARMKGKMALGPQSELTEEDVRLLIELEDQIDGMLDRRFTGDSIFIELGRKAGKYLVREKLRARYQEAGWRHVEFVIHAGGRVRMQLEK